MRNACLSSIICAGDMDYKSADSLDGSVSEPNVYNRAPFWNILFSLKKGHESKPTISVTILSRAPGDSDFTESVSESPFSGNPFHLKLAMEYQIQFKRDGKVLQEVQFATPEDSSK